MAVTNSRLLLNSPILLIELFTLLLLGYIAYGEVNHQYPRFVLAKMEAQAETLKAPLDTYLQAAIPIDQFSGYNTQGRALIESDPDIEVIRVLDQEGEPVFEMTGAEHRGRHSFTSMTEGIPEGAQVAFGQSEESYRAVLELKGKFGPAGRIEIETTREAVHRVVDGAFEQVAYGAVVIFALFSALVLIFDQLSRSRPALADRQRQLLNGAYFTSFAITIFVIVVAVYGAYDLGARAKAKALTDSMAQRISAVLDLGLELGDIRGINEAFRDYQARHSDINAVALMDPDGRVLFHIESGAIGKPYRPVDASYEYRVALGGAGHGGLQLAVSIPMEVVSSAILAQAKEFVVVLIACGLMSWVFLDAGTGLLTRLQGGAGQRRQSDPIELGLKLIKPAYFLIVFTSALPVSFLPQLAKEMADATHWAYATATLPFTIYYLVFALVLIPAGRYAEHGSLKRLMGLGFVTELIGVIFIALGDGYWMLTIGRIFSGFGQGVFLIGLNSYTLSITPKERRTLGNTVKVNGRNAALISGTAIGALLYTYMTYQSLFLVASAISVIGMLYLVVLVPAVDDICALVLNPKCAQTTRAPRSGPKTGMWEDLIHVMKDPEFLRTLGLVGVVGKIAIAGVIMFATPLILAQKGFPSGDIGLALMLFYVASIIVTRYASTLVDYLGASRGALFFSAIVGGLGMLLMGVVGIDEWGHTSRFALIDQIADLAVEFNAWVEGVGIPNATDKLVVLGIILTGISNGLLAAPIMTHIDKTPVAHLYGNKAVAAIYLFLERSGHVLGPMVISGLLALTYNTPLGIALFGLLTILLGGIFLITSRVPAEAPAG